MAIAKTASRNVAFKVARMRESIMEDQDELTMIFLIKATANYRTIIRMCYSTFLNNIHRLLTRS